MPGAGFDFNVGSSTTESDAFGRTTPRDPGGGFLNAILADIFGTPTTLRQGKFILGAPEEFVPFTTEEEVIQSGLTELTANDFKTAKAVDELTGETRRVDSLLAQANAEARSNFPQQVETTGQFGQFGSILDLLDQGNPLAGGARGLIDQAVGRQGDLFGLSADALSGLISGAGQPVDTSALASAGFTDLKEQFAGLGGLFSSDLQSEQLRLGTELQVAAQESARQRQLQALGLAQGFGQAQLGFSGSLLGLGSELNRTETAGGRELGFLRQLSQLQSGNLFSEGSDVFNKSSTRGSTQNLGVGVQASGA